MAAGPMRGRVDWAGLNRCSALGSPCHAPALARPNRPGPSPPYWTRERDSSWSALGRFRAVRLLDDRWALEDLTRDQRLVEMYATLPLAQGVAAYMLATRPDAFSLTC